MRQIEWTINPTDADPDGIIVGVSTVGALDIPFTGVLISGGLYTGDSEGGNILARKIGITSAGNDTGVTFTLTGTDPDGKAQTEDITGASGDIAESVGYYQTLSSVATDGATAAGITVGTVDEFSTQTCPMDHGASDAITISLERFTSAIDVSVEETFSRIQYTDSIEFSAGPTALQGQTSASSEDLSNHASGWRLVCNSYTSGADLRVIANSDRS
jgi:hypothetical protein